VLPRPLRQLHRWMDSAGLAKPRFFFRLRARAPV
jgi:hypothetical protein